MQLNSKDPTRSDGIFRKIILFLNTTLRQIKHLAVNLNRTYKEPSNSSFDLSFEFFKSNVEFFAFLMSVLKLFVHVSDPLS